MFTFFSVDPASAPCCVKIKKFDTDFAILTWGLVPKEYRNGVILGYKVY